MARGLGFHVCHRLVRYTICRHALHVWAMVARDGWSIYVTIIPNISACRDTIVHVYTQKRVDSFFHYAGNGGSAANPSSAIMSRESLAVGGGVTIQTSSSASPSPSLSVVS